MPAAPRLYLQDPVARGPNLLHAISRLAKGADTGGAIFAFASGAGVDALFEDKYVKRLVGRGDFQLVVGIDSITNRKTLLKLSDLAAARTHLEVRVLMHGVGSLMHPKICWFRRGKQLTLVVGSGNLTLGGLVTNFEAFTVLPLRGSDAKAAQAEIDNFMARWRAELVPPDDPDALSRAAKNSGSELSLKKAMKRAPEEPTGKPTPGSTDQVLICDIPKNVDERTQMDVGKEKFTTFFRSDPKGDHILIQSVDASGKLGAVEARAIFPTKSSNYRFEAGAGAHRKYPMTKTRRPLGVFLQQPSGIFTYRLLWPRESGYKEVAALLTAKAGPFKQKMRRETVTVADLAAAWPTSPLL